MRNLTKLPIPAILADKAEEWTAAFMADPENETARVRYRDPSIKATLRQETGDKCLYCESKVGHNTPGDVEHKVPTTADRTLHFSWDNLSLACGECNRRKNRYNDPALPFLDPYHDDVEAVLLHLGPIVHWRPGESRAEVTVRRLQLNGTRRMQLITQKIEKVQVVSDAIERYHQATDPVQRSVLRDRVVDMCARDEEYSGMVIAVVAAAMPDAL